MQRPRAIPNDRTERGRLSRVSDSGCTSNGIRMLLIASLLSMYDRAGRHGSKSGLPICRYRYKRFLGFYVLGSNAIRINFDRLGFS